MGLRRFPFAIANEQHGLNENRQAASQCHSFFALMVFLHHIGVLPLLLGDVGISPSLVVVIRLEMTLGLPWLVLIAFLSYSWLA